ncbi:hypothetical protein CC2G_014245 [Coprinopsis cinerea AmutBmut pab1-1]|nr:hypothetical protein CC2G_014245 [Coprinopsis cinerea AmutBmut pab1-1]
MPGKHVHFADAFPATPSPSFSVNSLPSTSGPYTPQSVTLGYLPLPPTYSGVFSIHPVLKYSTSPVLAFDISLPTTSIQPRDPNVTPYVLAQPATEPPLPFLEITAPGLPWKITIHPVNKNTPVPIVTVADVLHGIYASLRLPISQAEYNLIPSEQARSRINDAYRYRCKRLADPQAVERESKKGIKRIDFLTENTTFMGLSSTKHGGHVWQLNLSR